MRSVLSLSDYSEHDWGSLELSEDSASYRAFWAAVLQFATADQADAVYYRLDRGEDCLATQVDGETHVMVPPPFEYRQELLAAARRLIVGGLLNAAVRRLHRLFEQSNCLGQIVLETPTGDVEWHAYALPDGLRMSRAKTAS